MGRRDESESSGSQEDYSYDYSSYDYSGSDSKSGGANPERKGGKDVGSKDGSYSYSYSGSEDYDGSYSYSGTYSYSGSNTSAKVPSTAVPAATATGGLTPTVSAAVPTGHSFDASTNSSKRKEASGKDSKTGSSYYSGYSNYSSQDRYYSYDEEDTSERTGDSYSYSYSESATKDDSKPQNDPQEKPSDSYSYSYSNSYYSYDESSEKETYSRTRGSSLEDDSYSYGYSSTISKRRSTGKAEAEGSSETTGDYEYSYTPYSADTTDGSRYYSGSTNRTSYSYSYSTDSAVPEQRSLHEAAEKLPSTEDSYYSKTRSTTSGGVRDTGSSYTASDSNSYYYSYSESSSSALTSQQETAKGVKTVTEDVAVDDLSRSTTSSYQYTDEKHSSRSSSTDDMTEVQREVVILATPSRDIPQPPAPPKRCFVVPQSTEDALYAAVAQVMAMQKSYNERFNPPKSAMFSTEEIVMKQKRGKAPAAKSSTPDAVAPDGMFSKRFTRVLLGVLEMPHHERQAALAGAATPTSFGTLLNTFILSATTQVKEHMAHAFLAQDPYRSGELPLSVVANVLHGMGVAESPTIEGVRINVALTSDRTAGEIAMSVETLKEGGVGEVEGCGSSIEHIYMTEIVRRGIEEKTPIAIRWKDSNITAGPYVICRNIKEEHNYQRLKTFIEAATYICVLVNVFSIVDADGSVLVLYPHLVRSVLLMESPTGDGRRPIYLDNLFRHVYSPDRYLAAYSQGKTLPLYHRKAAMESVMQTTCDGDDKRSIVAIPAMSHDRHKFSKPAPPPPENLCIEVQLSKVRVPAAVPANSRCFCLISLAGANAGPSGLLPAVEVPVAQIRSSKKESGSFTWTFVDRTHPESRSTLLCVGGPDEQVWIEYCFEVPVEQNEGEVALPTSNNNRNSASTVVYSAGYSHMALSDAQGGTIDVHEGCLFDALGKNESPTNGTEGPAGSKAQQPEERERKPKKGLFGCVSSLLPKPSLKAKTATCARLNVTTAKKSSIALSEGLPDRFIVLKRHAPILGELRASIVDLGKQCSHTVQAMRHQFVKRALHVAADAVLLDQLDRLWKYRKAHPTKRAGGSPSPTETLLYSASMIFALHTISESEKHTFADLLTKKGKHVKSPFDEEARQPPVFY